MLSNLDFQPFLHCTVVELSSPFFKNRMRFNEAPFSWPALWPSLSHQFISMRGIPFGCSVWKQVNPLLHLARYSPLPMAHCLHVIKSRAESLQPRIPSSLHKNLVTSLPFVVGWVLEDPVSLTRFNPPLQFAPNIAPQTYLAVRPCISWPSSPYFSLPLFPLMRSPMAAVTTGTARMAIFLAMAAWTTTLPQPSYRLSSSSSSTLTPSLRINSSRPISSCSRIAPIIWTAAVIKRYVFAGISFLAASNAWFHSFAWKTILSLFAWRLVLAKIYLPAWRRHGLLPSRVHRATSRDAKVSAA